MDISLFFFFGEYLKELESSLNPRFGFEHGASGFFEGTPMHEYPRASFLVIFNQGGRNSW
jgi:hypothetical protein